MMIIMAAIFSGAMAFQSTPPSRLPSSTNCFPSIKRNPPSASALFDWSLSYTSKVDSHHAADTEKVPAISIHSLLESGRIDDAAAELKAHGSNEIPASTYHAVIEACCAGGMEPQNRHQKNSKRKDDRIELAAELLTCMGGDVTAHAHEILISGYARRGRWQDASKTLSSLEEVLNNAPSSSDDGKKSNTITPSLNVYQTVLTSFAKANQFNQVYSLLTRMRRRGVKPTVYTFNSLLKICASDKVPRWKEGLSLLSQCQREPGVNPDLITFTTAMRACARGRQAGKAMELFRVVKDMDMKLDVYVYTTAMDACAKAGGGRHWRKALSLLDEMKEEGISPNEVTYGVAVTACGNGGQWERALELLDQMRGMKLKINTITYNSAIAALSTAARTELKQRTGDADVNILWQKALDLIKCMEEEGVRRDVFTYSSAISTCGAAGRWEEAVALIKDMKADGTKPNKVAYTSAISACANSRYVVSFIAVFLLPSCCQMKMTHHLQKMYYLDPKTMGACIRIIQQDEIGWTAA